jgi:hypothetical protein
LQSLPVKETAQGFELVIASAIAIGVSPGTVLVTIHARTMIARLDTVDLDLGTLIFNESDSLFQACLLAPKTIGNALQAIINSKCGDDLIRDELNQRFSISQLRIEPNPARISGAVTATLSFNLSQDRLIRVAVYDLVGRLKLEAPDRSYHQGLNAIPLDLSTLPSGNYFINMNAEGEHHMLRLVIQK